MAEKGKTNEEFEVGGVKKKRQKCDIRQRTMWYYAPLSRVNIWKKSEAYSRKYFLEWKICKRTFDQIQANRDFITKFSNETTEMEQ